MCQQMKFMFGETMSGFEKLKTRVESRLSKKGRKARKNSRRAVSPPDENVTVNSKNKAEDDVFNHSSGFVHIEMTFISLNQIRRVVGLGLNLVARAILMMWVIWIEIWVVLS